MSKFASVLDAIPVANGDNFRVNYDLNAVCQ